MKNALSTCLLLSFFLLLTGCASIMTPGRFRPVPVETFPAGAQVYLNDAYEGTTPLSLRVDRKGTHRLSVQHPGYETFRKEIKPGTNGWIWGNLVFGGLVGIIVDAVNGSSVTPKPGKFAVYLLPPGGDYDDRQQTKAAKQAWKSGGTLPDPPPSTAWRPAPTPTQAWTPAAPPRADPTPPPSEPRPQRSLSDYRNAN